MGAQSQPDPVLKTHLYHLSHSDAECARALKELRDAFGKGVKAPRLVACTFEVGGCSYEGTLTAQHSRAVKKAARGNVKRIKDLLCRLLAKNNLAADSALDHLNKALTPPAIAAGRGRSGAKGGRAQAAYAEGPSAALGTGACRYQDGQLFVCKDNLSAIQCSHYNNSTYLGDGSTCEG